MLSILAAGATNPHPSVSKISIVGNGPFQLQIETTANAEPQTQVISNPERLIIDIPGAMPAASLHAIPVHGSEVKRIRVSLFQNDPPVTRVVVDLNEPQWYRIAPSKTGFLVSLGKDKDEEAHSNSQPTIGWVSAKLSARRLPNEPAAFVVKRTSAKKASPSVPKLEVQFLRGMLTIRAHNATLSEVLFEVQKQTGAEMAIPSGTEQERVAADFGPAPASEVMGELLNGSGLNFVVIGSEADPRGLRSVILSRNAGPADSSAAFAQSNTSVPPVENVEIAPPEGAPPPEDDSSAPQTPPPGQPPTGAQTPNSPPPN